MSRVETRQSVYQKLDLERDYQDSMSLMWNHKGYPSLEAELLLVSKYVQDLQHQWASSSDRTKCLDIVRKITAMGVRCLETHGCPVREEAPIDVEKGISKWAKENSC